MLMACPIRPLRTSHTKRILLRVSRVAREVLVVSFAERDTDTSIEAPPSLLPARKYCDITGLEARILLACDFSQY